MSLNDHADLLEKVTTFIIIIAMRVGFPFNDIVSE